MKRNAILLSASLFAMLIAGAAPLSAQGMGGPGMRGPGGGYGMMGEEWGRGRRGMMGMGCPMMGFGDGETTTFAEGRIAFLKAELKITDAQKEVWEAYVGALKTNLETMKAMHELMRTSFETKSPVERLGARIAAMETRVNALKEMQPALAKLHGVLDASQRETADELLTTMGCM